MLEIYFSVEKILHIVIVVIGIPVNLVAMLILSRGQCGLSICTTRYLMAMAAADLSVVVAEVFLYRINYHYFQPSFLDFTPVCRVLLTLTRVTTECSVWFTITFTLDRFVAICCQRLKAKYCTGRTAAVVLATTVVLLCLKNVPFYFAFEPIEFIDKVPRYCVMKRSYYTEPSWVAFNWFDTVFNPLFPFAAILLINALTIRHILLASRIRKELRIQSKGANGSDPEMKSRRRSVVLLFAISGSFILLWLTHVAEFFYYAAGGERARLEYSDPENIFALVGYLLRDFSCCTNTFIYTATQSMFREQLRNAVKYPTFLLLQFLDKSARRTQR